MSISKKKKYIKLNKRYGKMSKFYPRVITNFIDFVPIEDYTIDQMLVFATMHTPPDGLSSLKTSSKRLRY